jgi:dTDP-4-dehydrorhamnose 3,5-epimerase
MELVETEIPGCVELQPRVLEDARGRFVKPFQRSVLGHLGIATDFAEIFYSVSRARVLRGLHFQLPPHDHAKLVHCTAGEILDVAVDLRRGSPTFGQHVVRKLSAKLANALYIPRGLAHGFYSLAGDTTVVYHVTSEHEPRADSGIRWDSAGVQWPDDDPIVSDRDGALTPLQEFDSPFRFND